MGLLYHYSSVYLQQLIESVSMDEAPRPPPPRPHGTLALINATPYDGVKHGFHSYQITGFDWPVRIGAGGVNIILKLGAPHD